MMAQWGGYWRTAMSPQDIPNETFRLHILGLAHTKTTTEYSSCAYSQKVLKMCKMMRSLGHEVYHYGVEGSDPECTEHVDVVSNALQERVYGGVDWRDKGFQWNPQDDAYRAFNVNAVREILARKADGDLLLVSIGDYQKPIADAVGALGMECVEMGIGYLGVFAKYRVYESYSWMHALHGAANPECPSAYADWAHVVIPNYYEPADFEFSATKDDYYLFIGRLVEEKGPQIAAQTVERVGGRLIVAGQGERRLDELGLDKPFVEYVGTVGPKARSDLMKSAKAVFVPSLYIEPFGGVAVEAAFCGTPTITTDWGAFPETVAQGVTGFRCRSMDQFVAAAEKVEQLNPMSCRRWAEENYSLDRVKYMYQEYFSRVHSMLRGDGWEGEAPDYSGQGEE